jgi:hypothetical protein
MAEKLIKMAQKLIKMAEKLIKMAQKLIKMAQKLVKIKKKDKILGKRKPLSFLYLDLRPGQQTVFIKERSW